MGWADITVDVGKLLAGRYRLERLIGHGATSRVFVALDEATAQRVALKVLRAELVTNHVVVDRFLREPRAMRLVRHPHVVEVYSLGIDDAIGTPFLVQELLHGVDLARHVAAAGGALEAAAALELLLPVLDAVGWAHGQGVVHRDLKPSNIFLHRDARGSVVPKVLDFGMSAIADHGGAERLTITGTMLGTPLYMAPEQMKNARRADARADVWSLGVILYEALAGRPPFQASSTPALFAAVFEGTPEPLERRVPGIAPGVAQLVARCLEREPDARFANATELARHARLVLNAPSGQWVMQGAGRYAAVDPAGAPAPSPPRAPEAPVARSALASDSGSLPALRAVQPAAARPRVMIIDDDAARSSAVAAVLAQGGCEVACVADAFALPFELGRFKPDVVVARTDLPGMRGAQLAAVVKKLRGRSAYKLVFLGADEDDVALRALCAQTGAAGYLPGELDAGSLAAQLWWYAR